MQNQLPTRPTTEQVLSMTRDEQIATLRTVYAAAGADPDALEDGDGGTCSIDEVFASWSSYLTKQAHKDRTQAQNEADATLTLLSFVYDAE